MSWSSIILKPPTDEQIYDALSFLLSLGLFLFVLRFPFLSYWTIEGHRHGEKKRIGKNWFSSGPCGLLCSCSPSEQVWHRGADSWVGSSQPFFRFDLQTYLFLIICAADQLWDLASVTLRSKGCHCSNLEIARQVRFAVSPSLYQLPRDVILLVYFELQLWIQSS